jgi:hypothetical protein
MRDMVGGENIGPVRVVGRDIPVATRMELKDGKM